MNSTHSQSTTTNPDVANGRCLGSMFTAIVAAMDVSGRQKLADIVEYCHTRRALGLDSRALPVLFYQTQDEVLQQIATRHLQNLRFSFPQCRLCGRLTCPHCSHLYVNRCNQHVPLNDCPKLSEQCLLSLMDENTKREYVRARYYGDKNEIAEICYRYLLQLTNSEIDLDDSIRQMPVMNPEEEARLMAGNEDHGDEDFWDEEDLYSDFEDSFYSNISDITYETSQQRQPRNFFEDDSGNVCDIPNPSQSHVRKGHMYESMHQDVPSAHISTTGF